MLECTLGFFSNPTFELQQRGLGHLTLEHRQAVSEKLLPPPGPPRRRPHLSAASSQTLTLQASQDDPLTPI